MRANLYFRRARIENCLSGAFRLGGMYGVTAGEALRARPGRHLLSGKEVSE